jgi:uncharacterized repeat protein (TIGR01451 family)
LKAKQYLPLAVMLAALMALTGVITGFASADVTGATATKNCQQGPFNLGQTIPCTFTVVNAGAFPATIDTLTETSPLPGGVPGPITCVGSDNVTYHTGDTLPQGVTCSGAFTVPVGNDPATCGTLLRDRVEIDLSYPQFDPPLTAGAFATATTAIVCPAQLTATKVADKLSKPTDPVTYTITVTNPNVVAENRVSVIDTLVGDISSNFPATLAPGQTASYTYQRTVLAGDPNPLVNVVTAIYGDEGTTATATASASTALFHPSVQVTKNCAPSPIEVGGTLLCTIVITNTSTGTTPPALQLDTQVDTRAGNLALPGNVQVVSNNCLSSLANGGSCTIVTTDHVGLSDLPGPVTDSVTVHYHPLGFPNDIHDTAAASVPVTTTATMTLTKNCSPAVENVGDTTTYTFVITNTGDVPLTRQSVNDTLLGNIGADFPATLAPGQSATVTETRTVLAGDPSPLPNTVTSIYGNSVINVTITKSASCSIVIKHPAMTLTKACNPPSAHVGDTVQYGFTVTNTGDVTLNLKSAVDTLLGDLSADFPATLAPGQSVSFNVPRVILLSDPNPLPNTVTTTYQEAGFTVTLTKTASCSVTIIPPGTVKLTIGFWKTHAPKSCKQGNGNQADALTPALGSGFQLGTGYKLTDPCTAVKFLSKNVLGNGDPIGNMLAQMIGAELNLAAGGSSGGSCSFITQAITDANTLLTAINFNGTGHAALTNAQKDQANTLEGLFSSYNNDSTTC